MDERVAANQRRWEEMTELHLTTYRVEERDAEGVFSLKPFEPAELGDIIGQRICHLQCHLAENTFALVQRGAASAVGVDFSARSIEVATARSHKLGLSDRVSFVHATVDDAPEVTGGGFDGVYTSWGVLCWLPDIDRWAQVVHDLLAPGGWLYVADSHPYAYALRQPTQHYGGATAMFSRDQGDYTSSDATFEHPDSWEWNHGLGEIVTAIARAELSLEWLHEHPVVAWHLNQPGGLVQRADGMWEQPGSALPLSFSLRARR